MSITGAELHRMVRGRVAGTQLACTRRVIAEALQKLYDEDDRSVDFDSLPEATQRLWLDDAEMVIDAFMTCFPFSAEEI